MNKKGFAMSAIIYPILLICLSLIVAIIINLSSGKDLLDNLKNDIKNSISIDSYNAILTIEKKEATQYETTCFGCGAKIVSVSNYTDLVDQYGNPTGSKGYINGTCSNGHTSKNSHYGLTVGTSCQAEVTCTGYKCDAGWEYSSGYCLRQVYSCPSGGVLNGTICEL